MAGVDGAEDLSTSFGFQKRRKVAIGAMGPLVQAGALGDDGQLAILFFSDFPLRAFRWRDPFWICARAAMKMRHLGTKHPGVVVGAFSNPSVVFMGGGVLNSKS